MWNKTLKNTFILVAIIAFSYSCRSKKEIKKAGVSQSIIALQEADSVLNKVVHNNYSYANFKAKIRTRYNDNKGKKHVFTTILRIQKDTAIYAKLSAFGIPVATIYLTPDSIFSLNRLEKTYLKNNFQFINKIMNSDLSFYDIQNLLTGNPVFLNKNKKHILIKKQDGVFLKEYYDQQVDSVSKSMNWEVSYWVNQLFKSGKTVVTNSNKKSHLLIQNYDFKDVDGQLFPDKINVNFVSPKDTVDISLNYRKIKTEKNTTFTFAIPKNYTQQK